nr:unnamed protein product [Callosobruchus analis]
MENYLVDRYQCVNVENNMSDFKKVEYGIPQASVLGTILFNIYLADLHQQATVGKIISFADDTVIVYKSNTWEKLKTIAESDFKHLKVWFDYILK